MTEKCKKIMELYYEAVYAEDKRKSCRQKACATVNVQWNAETSTARYDGYDPYWKAEARKWDLKNCDLRQEIEGLMDEDVKKEIKTLAYTAERSYSVLQDETTRERVRSGVEKGYSALQRKERVWDIVHGIMCGVLVIGWIASLFMWFLIGCDALTNTWPDEERALYLTIGYWLLGVSVASILLFAFVAKIQDKSVDARLAKEQQMERWNETHGNMETLAKLKAEYEKLDKMIHYLGI